MFLRSMRNAGLGALAMSAMFGAIDGVEAAEDRRVRIINETDVAIVQFYGSNAGADTWEEDILGEDILPPGESVVINFDDGTGYCLFDFKAVFADGDVVIREDIDVCRESSFRFYSE